MRACLTRTLHQLGFVTDEESLVFRSLDGGLTYVEIFTWVEGGFGPGARASRGAGNLGADGSAARRTRRAAQVGFPALPARAAASVSPRPRGLAELDAFDAVFGALANRSRRTILSVLHARGGEMTSGAIAARFECSWPTTSQHLRVLQLEDSSRSNSADGNTSTGSNLTGRTPSPAHGSTGSASYHGCSPALPRAGWPAAGSKGPGRSLACYYAVRRGTDA
jgi:hypothetical protein